MACSALFILMIISSSICHHFSTFPFVKLIEQFNELKSFRKREKNTHPSIITVIKSGNYGLALPDPVTGLQPPWAGELQQGLRKVKQRLLEPLYSWLFCVQAPILSRREYPVYHGAWLSGQARFRVSPPDCEALQAGLGRLCPFLLPSAL